MSDLKDYDRWLERLYSKLPKTASTRQRFELPEIQSIIARNRTVIRNLKQIAAALNRPVEHVLRFLAKELATAGGFEGDLAIFQGRFSPETLARALNAYVRDCVLCPVCGSPDTRIVREERLRFLLCEACGAKSSVRC
ncbi:translation initiation factor IF-2 subunit beta [Candidatus Bathyarchaeota archaeon]|nr:MAG: translation initiation factor IF-2 subunit beta [Candidatus Bathyarchaeota archaeon]